SRHFSPPAPFREDMRLRARGKDFALCGARPKGSALWTSANWAQLDQLMSAASPPKNPHDGALNQNLSPLTASKKLSLFSASIFRSCGSFCNRTS
ncbi:MAG: hypothetical protein HDT21_11720, partial [Ruminococcus sp.]|nr:hypothetical protein [Ruminococcus sp.]